MKKLVLITGDLATGKTSFARILSLYFQLPYFSKDEIKEVLGDTIGFTTREENLKLSKATIELMNYIFHSLAKEDTSLILESNFHTKELERIHALAKKYQYDVLTLVLRGDISILHQRYLKRMREENRHPVHLSTSFEEWEQFRIYIENSRTEEIPGKILMILADDFSYQEDKGILSSIQQFLE